MIPARLPDYTPWRFAWHQRGKPSLIGLAAVDGRLSVLEEGNSHAVLSERRRTGKPRSIHIAHHKDGTRAWTAYRPSFLGVLLTWLAFGAILTLSFLVAFFDSFDAGSGTEPLGKLRDEVRKRADAGRTGAGTS